MRVKFVYCVLGGHTHANVYAGMGGERTTLGKCGTVVFRNEEFEILKRSLEAVNDVFNLGMTTEFVEHKHG